jgi:hypothetical protein
LHLFRVFLHVCTRSARLHPHGAKAGAKQATRRYYSKEQCVGAIFVGESLLEASLAVKLLLHAAPGSTA